MLKRLLLTASILFVLSDLLFAQATGTINGRVVDQAGAVVPGVSVTVTNVRTGVARDTVTNAEGLYSVPALNPGTYDLRAEISGFAPFAARGVELITGSTRTVDVELGLGQLAETVTVTGVSPLVEPTQATLAASILQSEVVQMPMLNRSLSAMMNLLPGAREVPAQGAHGHAASYVSFGGDAGRSFNMLVDGTDNKEDHDGGTTMVYSLEGVEEFKVLKSSFSAEYGKAPTVVTLATKSGTNQVRGSVFGFGRNEALIATDFFSKPENGGLGKQPFSRTQFGGSIGGPLVRDRAWYFGSVERVQQEFTLPRPDNLYREMLILEGLNIGAVASRSVSQPFRDLLVQVKTNVQVRQNHGLFVRYASQNGYVDNPFVGTGRALQAHADVSDRNDQTMWNVAGGWTWLISPTTVNQFSAQYLYYDHNNIYPPCPPETCEIGRLNFPSVSTGASVAGGFRNWHNLETKIGIKDDLSKQVGRHAFKFGAEYMVVPVYGGTIGAQSPGGITFFHDPSVIVNNTNALYPQGFRTPGIVRSITVASGTIGDYASAGAWNLGAYMQDEFRVTPRLTLNLGVRYDVYEYMNQPEMDQNRTYLDLKAIGSPFGALPKTDTNNVSPRVGLAWDAGGDGKNVLRAGYGLFYGQGIMNTFFQPNILAKEIIYFPQTFANSAIGSGQLANFVYGVTPLPTAPFAPTEFPAGQSVQGTWYDPNLKDPSSHQYHGGFSHLFSQTTVLTVDYVHVRRRNGWRFLNINPLLDHDNNPATPRVRPLSAETLRVYGDPNRLGPTNIAASVNRSLYDEVAVHFERRVSRTAFQINYALAWARGMAGSSDVTTQGGQIPPQIPSAFGGELDHPWEWGPTSYDERHRVTVAGVFNLPFEIDVSPSITAASARPYTQYRAVNPSGDGFLQLLGPDGNPIGLNNARGTPLVNANARVTKNVQFSGTQKISVFAEFYNLFNRANFGNFFNGNAFAPATYNQPNGYLGGIGSTSTIPISFQVQFGARFTF